MIPKIFFYFNKKNFEPYYFKNSGEKTAEEVDTWNKIRDEQQVAVRMKMGFSGGSFKPRISNYFEHETDPETDYENARDPIIFEVTPFL